jgi:hypothetical protein
VGIRIAAALVVCASCSFVAVHGPVATPNKPLECTDSDVVPSIDAAAGALLVAGAIAGEVADHVSSHPIQHFELIIGLPALVAGIVYFVSASHGTDKVSACRRAHEGRERGCDGCPAEVP